ncbi:MAG TPA: hypothetical protein VNN06_09280 [Ramlibacter sp.]|nr:hypothetical protein [Ramlibacter sp.]
MNARAVRCAVAGAAVWLAWPDVAQAQPSDCRVAELPTHPLAQRGETLMWFEQMPEGCLKSLFMECAEAANERFLDLGSAAICSIGYEALLRQGFGGDFHALIAWWRREREAEATD